MTAPSRTCEALVANTTADASLQLVKQRVPIPQPSSRQLLIKVQFVAQNPTDVQSFDSNAFGDGAVLGCDFVGSIEKIGADVTRFREKQVVAGLIWGGEVKLLGAYSEYCLADESICFEVPEGISPKQASTIPLAATTSLLALFSKDCLAIRRDGQAGTPVCIWGGSSSVGLYAIQIAALYGLNVVTTCSPRFFDVVRSYGASHAFDYHDDTVVDKVRMAVPNLKFVFDTIGNNTSSGIASQCVTGTDGILCTVRPGKANTDDAAKHVKITDVLVWTAFLKEHRYAGFHWPTHPEDHELAKKFFLQLPSLLAQGKIKPNTPRLLEGGLNAVHQGFQEYRDGKISGVKVVYKI